MTLTLVTAQHLDGDFHQPYAANISGLVWLNLQRQRQKTWACGSSIASRRAGVHTYAQLSSPCFILHGGILLLTSNHHNRFEDTWKTQWRGKCGAQSL